jgi:hypothetical protein
MKTKKILILSLIIANIFALVYLLFLGYYNSLLLDDYGMIDAVKEKGVNFILDMYLRWLGRFGAYTINYVLFKIAPLLNNLLPLTILQLVLGYGCVYLLLRFVFDALNRSFVFLLSVTIFNLGVLGLLEFSTFYWVCASGYVTIASLTIALIPAVFDQKINKYIALVLILILSYFVGGGLETYTPLVIIGLGIVFLYRLKIIGLKSILRRRLDRQLIAALVLLSIFCLLMIIAPGNKVRMGADSQVQTTGFPLLMKTGFALIKFLFAVGSKLIYFIASFPLFYWAGYQLQQKKFVLSCKYASKKQFIISCVLLLLFLYVAVLPIVYIMSVLIPSLRPYSYISFAMIAFFGYWGVMLGYKQHHKKILITTLLASCICIIGVSCWRMNRDFHDAVYYHNEIENRLSQIQKLKDEGYEGVAYIEPIRAGDKLSLYSASWNFVKEKLKIHPEQEGLIQSSFPYELFSLSADSVGDWRNQQMKQYFDVQFDILSKE